MSDVRVLGRVRLSRATEESTSVERQREVIERWAAQSDHTIVGWAEDLDLSGSVDPFDAPELGKWLTEERKHEWDVICSWKLDRVSRRAVPMGKLFGWLLDNDKALVCCADSIDLSTPMGRLIAYVIATIAEGELEAIRERNRSSHRKLAELGRWTGGKPMYGYRPQEREDYGWELVPDEYASGVLLRIIERVIEGESLNSIADDLSASGEPTPNDYLRQRAGKPTGDHAWTGGNLSRLLRSSSLLGYTVHNGVTVRDDEGVPVRKGPPLVSQDLYDRLQATLESRSVVSGTRTRNTSPLLGVLVCLLCESRMYHRRVTAEKYRYYFCRNGHAYNAIRADEAEELVEETFLAQLGDQKAQERVYVQAENHQIELEEAVRAVDELTSLLGTTTSATMRKRLTDQLSALDSRLSVLETLPVREARWNYRETSETYGEAWAAADLEGRRLLLLRSGITAAVKNIDRALTFELRIPEDVLLRMTKP